MSDVYDFADRQINDQLHVDIDYTSILAVRPYPMALDVLEGFVRRHEVIRSFQDTTLELFRASLRGDVDPFVADLILSELPEVDRHAHGDIVGCPHHGSPLFFRTDEVVPGKISEIQCPGSAWGIHTQIRSLYEAFPDLYGKPKHFRASLAQGFAESLCRAVGGEPVLHHLTDNASIPSCARYFLHQTRKQGLRYFGYDKNVTAYDCNVIRAHDYVSLRHDNYAKHRMAEWAEGRVLYDLPPSILFEVKSPIALPFWEKTKEHYSDEVRSLFPYTQVITPQGLTLENGEQISLKGLVDMSRAKREYYIKYAGSDISLNWGSKGVFFAKSLSRAAMKALADDIAEGFSGHRYWILQKSHLMDDHAEYFQRDGTTGSGKVHTKFSGFYGPEGLLGVLVMQRPFYKVHGSSNTITSICH